MYSLYWLEHHRVMQISVTFTKRSACAIHCAAKSERHFSAPPKTLSPLLRGSGLTKADVGVTIAPRRAAIATLNTPVRLIWGLRTQHAL
jgi:hypothetical protein